MYKKCKVIYGKALKNTCILFFLFVFATGQEREMFLGTGATGWDIFYSIHAFTAVV